MIPLTKVSRILVPVFSLALLASYVVYSHVTPNFPPPDAFGLSPNDTARTSSLSTTLPAQRSRGDLRIISSKVINQPIFSVRKLEPETPEFRAATADFKLLGLQMVKDLEVVPGIVTTAPQPAGFLLKRPVDSLQQPEAIKRILFDDDAAASSEKMLTPEKLSEDYYRALEMLRPMMSGSKSGMVRFDATPSMTNPVLPIKPAPALRP